MLGRLKLTGSPAQGLEVAVAEIVMHPDYTDYEKGQDIALIRLAEPVSFNREVSPVCLPFAGHRFAFGTQCWISGWGDVSANGERGGRPLQRVCVCVSACVHPRTSEPGGRCVGSQPV